MSKKTLNKENLLDLGAEKLAELVLDLVNGDANLKRRVRFELSAAQGPKDIAADVRKRLTSLRRATSFLDWRKQRAFVKDLYDLVEVIEEKIAPDLPSDAFELLWTLLSIAPTIYERTDDSNGNVGDVFSSAMRAIENIASNVQLEPMTLADRLLDAIVDAGYGEFDGIIPATAPILGNEGLEHLKSATQNWSKTPPTEQELEGYSDWGIGTRSPEDIVQSIRDNTSSVILADIADAQGDVDAYMARYTAEQLTYGTIAPGVARRLLDANRVQEAMDVLERCEESERGKPFRMLSYEFDKVYEECLEKLGQTDELKRYLWGSFEQTLSETSLRKYLKLCPDFDDVEAEEKALTFAESYQHLSTAVGFFLQWPDHKRAAKVIESRFEELDGNCYYTLTPAAQALEGDYPLVATLMRRAMIEDTLDGAKSKRYRYAAQHLAECENCDNAISDYGPILNHEDFVAALRKKHPRKQAFWNRVEIA